MSKYKGILFVCTGNSCRSAMAEGLFRKMLGDRTDIGIESAGVSTLEGIKATPQAIEVMRKEGVDISSHRTKRLSDEKIKKADLILVMEASHRETVVRIVPEAGSKVFLLGNFGWTEAEQNKDIEIPDPIGLPLERYEYCLDLIKKSLNGVKKKI